jgi:hypothetical protein
LCAVNRLIGIEGQRVFRSVTPACAMYRMRSPWGDIAASELG